MLINFFVCLCLFMSGVIAGYLSYHFISIYSIKKMADDGWRLKNINRDNF